MSISNSISENMVQSACADALAVYFNERKINYRQLWTYSNQQGEDPNKFCADLVGVIDSTVLLLMEFKALDHTLESLVAFDDDQFREAESMQKGSVPLVYCYDNFMPLPYYKDPWDEDWAISTLRSINASVPSMLFGIKPQRKFHATLLDWIDGRLGEKPKNCIQAFGKAVGCLMPNMARNKIISVLFSKQKNEALAMNENDLTHFNDWLASNTIPRDPLFKAKIKILRSALAQGTILAAPPKTSGAAKPGYGPKI